QLEVGAGHLSAHALDLLAVGGVPFALRDALAVHLRHAFMPLGEAAVPLDAEDHEGREDQQQQHELQQARMGADEIEHGKPLNGNAPAHVKKANRSSPFSWDRSCSWGHLQLYQQPALPDEDVILSKHVGCSVDPWVGWVVGADGIEPPTYAL